MNLHARKLVGRGLQAKSLCQLEDSRETVLFAHLPLTVPRALDTHALDRAEDRTSVNGILGTNPLASGRSQQGSPGRDVLREIHA